MGRQHGTGRTYVKYGSYYGRWRALDGAPTAGLARSASEEGRMGLYAARRIGFYGA